MKTIFLKVRFAFCILVVILGFTNAEAKKCTICITNSFGEQSLLTLNEYKPGCWNVTGTHDYSLIGGTIWPVTGSYSCITKKLHYVATNPAPDSCRLWANNVTFDYYISDMELTGTFSNDCGYSKGFTATAAMGFCNNPARLVLKQGEYGSTGSHKVNRSFLKLTKGANLNELLKDPSITISVTPNPAKQFAHISFSLESATKVQLRIYDMQGNLVHTLTEGTLAPGEHVFNWNLKSMKDMDVPRGFYWARIITEKGTSAKQVFVNR